MILISFKQFLQVMRFDICHNYHQIKVFFLGQRYM